MALLLQTKKDEVIKLENLNTKDVILITQSDRACDIICIEAPSNINISRFRKDSNDFLPK